jgi:lambda family phage portal protein
MSNIIDRIVSYVSPRLGAERQAYRAMMGVMGAQSSYRGGLRDRTSTGWSTRQGDPVGGTATDLYRVGQMRARARHADRNNPLACSILDRATENVIGTGIVIEPASSSPEWNTLVSKQWDEWCQECGVGGMDMTRIQRMGFRNMKRDGDVAVVLVDRGGRSRLQIVDGERVSSPLGATAPNLVDGVEVSKLGTPLAFHFSTSQREGDRSWQRISADDVVWLAQTTEPQQVRGVSTFSSLFSILDQLWGYIDAVVIASRLGACQSAFIQKANPSAAISAMTKQLDGSGNSRATLNLEPGMMHYLAPGEEVKPFNPSFPQQSFPEFVVTMARMLGVPFGLTVEQVLLDFSRANYSSARAARLQAEATAAVDQHLFCHTFLRRIYRWWLAREVKYGRLSNPPQDFQAHEWIPPARPWVDPTKEIDAATKGIALGIEARTYVARERGYKFSRLCEQNEADNALMREHNLSPIADLYVGNTADAISPLDKPASEQPAEGIEPTTEVPQDEQTDDQSQG